jgi:hypothetical protein
MNSHIIDIHTPLRALLQGNHPLLELNLLEAIFDWVCKALLAHKI